MENKRSNSLKVSIIKQVFAAILYVTASYFTCTGMFALYTTVSAVGGLFEIVFPITSVCLIPLFILIMYRRYNNAVGKRMKWKIGLGTVITTTVISLYSLISCLVIASSTTGMDRLLTAFFPLDIIIVDVVILLVSLLGLGFLIYKRSWLKEKKQMQQIKEYKNILIGLFMFVATFSFGAIIKCGDILIGADFDNNLPWILANYFILALPTIGVIFRLIYRYYLKPSVKRIGWIILISTFAFLSIAFFTWACVGFAINPYYYSLSLQSVFIGGFAFFNMPVEIFVILITCVTVITVSSVWFIKNSNK